MDATPAQVRPANAVGADPRVGPYHLVRLDCRLGRLRRAGGQVRVAVPAGEALWLSAAELESGGAGFEGSLGDGEGGWRLTVSSDAPLAAMSLVEDERGALGNVSTPGPRSLHHHPPP